MTYYPSPSNPLTAARKIQGIAAYADHIGASLAQLPAFRFDELVIFPQPKGLVVRYRSSWLGPNERLQQLAGTAILHFCGERISQIGVRLDTARFRQFLSG